MNNKISLLLDKLITLTKENKLNWKVYDQSNSEFNPEKRSIFSNTLASMLINRAASPIYSRSYVAQYNHGYIGLLVYTYMASSNYVELVLQADNNSMPNTVATSKYGDVEVSSKIKRLYNLIDLDSDTSSVSEYIDEILND